MSNIIRALQKPIGQGKRLDSVDLDTNGSYTSIFKEGGSFLLDLPSIPGTETDDFWTMRVQFEDNHIGDYQFKPGTNPDVRVVKVFDDVVTTCRQFQVIY